MALTPPSICPAEAPVEAKGGTVTRSRTATIKADFIGPDYRCMSGAVATDVTLNEDKLEMKSPSVRRAETPGPKTSRATDGGAQLSARHLIEAGT
ncbi:MAG: hypothetical protein PVG95_10985 [Methyloceanibacter sp.]|jgi:hypothetical protein